MTTESLTFRRVVAFLGIGAAAGAVLTYIALGSLRLPEAPASSAPAPVHDHARSAPSSEGAIMITPEAAARAGIKVAPVETARFDSQVALPAVIEPNAYQQGVVTALGGGRVARVLAELGQQVRLGQPLAELYSPDLADAQRAYVSTQAELRAHEQMLARTERLVDLGSASRQELEQAHAEHATLTASVEGARSRLELLGLPDNQIQRLTSAAQMTATTEVRAPIDGTLVGRDANAGLNVQAASQLFTVANLSTVWVVGNVYEKDFASVRVGSPAVITVGGFPGMTLRSTIDYIDPQVSPETRTARVRAQVGNPRGELRLGMYAQIEVRTRGGEAIPVVPKTALQTIGDRSVVYVVDSAAPNRFIERPVVTGTESDSGFGVVSGLKPGEIIVTEGSFFLRTAR